MSARDRDVSTNHNQSASQTNASCTIVANIKRIQPIKHHHGLCQDGAHAGVRPVRRDRLHRHVPSPEVIHVSQIDNLFGILFEFLECPVALCLQELPWFIVASRIWRHEQSWEERTMTIEPRHLVYEGAIQLIHPTSSRGNVQAVPHTVAVHKDVRLRWLDRRIFLHDIV